MVLDSFCKFFLTTKYQVSQTKYSPARVADVTLSCIQLLLCWGGFKFLVHRPVWCYRCLEISGSLVWCYWWQPAHSIRHKLPASHPLIALLLPDAKSAPVFNPTITFSHSPLSLHHQIQPKEKKYLQGSELCMYCVDISLPPVNFTKLEFQNWRIIMLSE